MVVVQHDTNRPREEDGDKKRMDRGIGERNDQDMKKCWGHGVESDHHMKPKKKGVD